ncbi:MAG: hypothetical protein HC906_03880 [Bacteroidales bacterium]|nr:hypothetical protein [Bacteroidales bacterium]
MVVSEINSLQIQLYKFFKATDNFLYIETTNPVFFVTGKSKYLDEKQTIVNEIQHNIQSIKKLSFESSFFHDKELDEIKIEFDQCNHILDSLVYLIYKQGYNNFGLEGEIIDNAGALEKISGLDATKILQIRRNEKDYLLRRDKFFIENFDRLINGLQEQIQKNRNFTANEKLHIINLVTEYSNSFHALVDLKEKIGLYENSGLKYRFNQKSASLDNKLSQLINNADRTKQVLVSELRIFYFLFFMLVTGLAVIISILISKHILVHLESLTQYISRLTESNFSYTGKPYLKNPSLEIKKIYSEFRNMVAQLHIWEGCAIKPCVKPKETKSDTANWPIFFHKVYMKPMNWAILLM